MVSQIWALSTVPTAPASWSLTALSTSPFYLTVWAPDSLQQQDPLSSPLLLHVLMLSRAPSISGYRLCLASTLLDATSEMMESCSGCVDIHYPNSIQNIVEFAVPLFHTVLLKLHCQESPTALTGLIHGRGWERSVEVDGGTS